MTVRPEAAPAKPGAASPVFDRVLLKVSGEALMGDQDYGIELARVESISKEIYEVQQSGVEVAIVVGGGNFYRGMAAAAEGMDRATADYAGMLATLLNALALQDALERLGSHTRVLSAIGVAEVAEPYIRRRAIRHLEKKRVVIFAAGTGNPFFTTDTAAALRALEIGAQAILMAKNKVEGVLDGDPRVEPDAELVPALTHLQAIERGLKVMDTTALSLCMDNRVPIHVFGIANGNIRRVIFGERVGTIIATPSEEAPLIDDLISDAGRRMDKSVESTQTEFNTVRTGRASAALLDRITVDYYGQQTPLQQLATINVPEPRLLTIQPFDPNSVKEIERAILESELGLTPSNDGKVIRLPIPQLTEERRKELVKIVRQIAEDGKIAIRNVRRDADKHLKDLKTKGEAGEDEERRAEDRVQKLTDEHIAKIDDHLKRKEAEITEV